MLHIKNEPICRKNHRKPRRFTFLFLTFFVHCVSLFAQDCPSNIDFEKGDFTGWTCYAGTVSAAGDQNTMFLLPSGGPVPGKHQMYAAGSGETDPFGGFPVNCPNGSGYSVKLGSTEAGGQAEGISYEFTIPANQNAYSLIYHYAVVFQSPNHREIEQPRMEIEVTNVTDNEVIKCASFTFIAVGTSLPGFQVSQSTDTTNVLYKNWSAVSVDLSGNAGKTIRLFFKTADCTFRRHFGYAYIDVNSECSGTFTGATYCPDDTVVSIIAPYGYQKYTWYDSSVTQVLGSDQSLTILPPLISGKTYAVKLEPFFGYGCTNTMFTQVRDSLTVISDAGKDALSCNKDPVSIGGLPKQGLVYQWSPLVGLSNPVIANPQAAPAVTTTYYLTTSNSGGGCKSLDSVVVRASVIDSAVELVGKAAFCFGYGDSAILVVQPTTSITWYRNGALINGATSRSYRVNSAGSYYAALTNDAGCSVNTTPQTIIIENPVNGIRYPDKFAVFNLPVSLAARQIGVQVLWTPATSLNTASSFTPTFTGARDQKYEIEIRTSAGCLVVDTQWVKTIEKVEVYVPTAFTPNNDGRNDLLRPVLKGVLTVNYFRIFNRWGELVFDGRNERGWDGYFKGLAQGPQSVVWVLECIGVDGNRYQKKGSTVLIK